MDIGELQYGRFEKLIRKLPSEEVQYFFDFFNLLQLYRNFSEIRPFFKGVPVDNPEVWLGSVLCDRKLQRKLIDNSVATNHIVNLPRP